MLNYLPPRSIRCEQIRILISNERLTSDNGVLSAVKAESGWNHGYTHSSLLWYRDECFFMDSNMLDIMVKGG